jgi:hypothetical protein
LVEIITLQMVQDHGAKAYIERVKQDITNRQSMQ